MKYNELFSNVESTKEWTHQFASNLKKPSVVILTGELGAGKTVMAKEIGSFLGVKEPLTSPSFSLMNYYAMHEGSLLHLDVYRLTSVDELVDLGLDDFFDSESILLVEWGEQFLSFWIEWITQFHFPVQGWHLQLSICEQNKRQLKGSLLT